MNDIYRETNQMSHSAQMPSLNMYDRNGRIIAAISNPNRHGEKQALIEESTSSIALWTVYFRILDISNNHFKCQSI